MSKTRTYSMTTFLVLLFCLAILFQPNEAYARTSLSQLQAQINALQTQVDVLEGQVDADVTDLQAQIDALQIQLDAIASAQVANEGEELRIIRGTVNADGTISQGTGFQIIKIGLPGNGKYELIFNPAFPTPPTVVASPIGGSGIHISVNTSEAAETEINIWHKLGDSWSSFDRPFHFIAIGQR